MKPSRAILVLLASLAGGTGIRLAFAIPAGPDKTRGPRTAEDQKTADAALPAAAAKRPSEEDILAARGASRLRLLMAWLTDAKEEELVRVAEAFAKSGGDDEYFCLRLLMARWAEVNPRAMLDWTRERSGGHYNTSYYVNAAIAAWARVDFAAAWAAANNGQPDTRRAALLALTVSDPDQCLRLLREDPSLLRLSGPFSFSDPDDIDQVMERLAAHDPAGVAALLKSAAEDHRLKFTGGFALAWAKKDPAAAVAWMKTLEPAVRQHALEDAGRWIAARAPEHLPDVLASLNPGRLKTVLQAAGLEQLAATDLPAARRQIETMSAGPARQYSRAILMKELFRRGDDEGAATLAAELGWVIQREWCPSYTETRAGAGRTTTTSSGREMDPAQRAMRELMGRIAARDPAQAARLMDKCADGSVGELFSGDLSANPAAMAEAVLKTGDSPERKQRYLKSLADDWMQKDPLTAINWAAEHGRTSMFMQSWSQNPAAAIGWAATLPAEKRLPLLRATIESWPQYGGDGVHNAIRGSSLPEEEKQQLLKLLPPP